MIETLQKILDEGGVLTFARYDNVVQILLRITINDKEHLLRVNVDKISDFLQERPLNTMLASIVREREMINAAAT